MSANSTRISNGCIIAEKAAAVKQKIPIEIGIFFAKETAISRILSTDYMTLISLIYYLCDLCFKNRW